MQTQQIYERLCRDGKKGGSPYKNWGITALVSLVLIFICAMAEMQGLMMIGILAFTVAFWAIIFIFLFSANSSMVLKKSISTLAATGSMQYIEEIFNRQYTTDGKVCFSEHLFYIPGQAVIAYQDITDISPFKFDYMIDTVDRKRHRVRVSQATLNELRRRSKFHL